MHLQSSRKERLTGKNASLQKFIEVLSRTKMIINNIQNNGNTINNLLVMGDFNFSPNIVTWEKSKRGLTADYSEGNTEEKRAFGHLLDLVDDLNLEQVVDKPTRGRNILDLIFTDKPSTLSDITSTVLKPLSDHNLVHGTISTDNITKVNGTKPASRNDIGQFNFKRANSDLIKDILSRKDWEAILDTTDIESLNAKFHDTLAEVAIEANVPKYPGEKVSSSQEISPICKEISRLTVLNDNITTRQVDRITNNERIGMLNEELELQHTAEREREETRAIEELKANPKSFYAYANKSRKTRQKIGHTKVEKKRWLAY